MVPGYRRDLAGHAFGHSLLRLSSAAFLAAGLGACLPADQRPDLGVAVTRSFAAGEPRAAPAVSPDWPRLFRSSELNRLVERTAGDNFDIAIAMTRIRQADAQSRISSAALYPTLSGSTDASRALRPGTVGSKRGPFSESIGNTFSLGLSASYELDFWGKNRSTADAGRFAAEATRFDRDVVALTAVASVASTYFQVLAAQDRLRIARENIAAAERILNAIRARLGLRYWSLAEFLKSRSGAAERYIGRFVQAGLAAARRRGLDGIVCGHIHRAALAEHAGLVYANDGDWVESLSALVEEADGTLRLLSHLGEVLAELPPRSALPSSLPQAA